MTTLSCSQGHLNSSDSRFCRLCGEVLTAPPEVAIAQNLLSLRYRVLSELGQGGFGRTYLAEDTNRFDEPCVLKEFAPQVEGVQALQKAQELFAREAGILYQLQHEQIPRFREMFRADWQGRERIFLVQDYVEGQTYHDLLKQRLQRGDRFSEAEVVQLLLQILPVLDYIHAVGVIHRDISPDNLIQRSSDHLPVLIDFGGVKQVAAKVASITSPMIPHGSVTRLGKIGYAPAEQLEQGEVSSTSDLYALAVTVLVLLTGKEPADLFSHNGQFDRHRWQQEVSLKPSLVKILATMLDPYPAKRYPSAGAVMQALQTAGYQLTSTAPVANPPAEPIPVFAPQTSATIAVAPKGPAPQPVTQAPAIAQPKGRGVGRTIASVLFLAGLIAAGGWAGVKWIGPALKSQLPEITEPTPKPPVKPTQPQEATFSKAEQERKQKIDTRRQQLGIDNGFLVKLVNEAFYAQHPELNGQKLGTGSQDADLRQKWDELALQYLDRLEALSRDARSRLGQYTQADVSDRVNAASKINLSSRTLNDLTDAAFFHLFPEQPKGGNLLNLEIGQVWQGVASDQLKLLQSGKTLERIEFPPGNFSDRRTGTLQPGQGKAYIANLGANQTLRLQLQPSQGVLLSVYPPSSQLPALLADAKETTWSGKLTASGYYEIVVVTDGQNSVNYAIDLAVADDVTTPTP